jgi:hypothetical protein
MKKTEGRKSHATVPLNMRNVKIRFNWDELIEIRRRSALFHAIVPLVRKKYENIFLYTDLSRGGHDF